jgi:hypothetical protein
MEELRADVVRNGLGVIEGGRASQDGNCGNGLIVNGACGELTHDQGNVPRRGD